MIAPLQASNRILQPAKTWFIVLTLLIATLLNLLPFADWSAMPDWAGLVLIFWAIHQPQRVGVGVAFLIGMAVDVIDGGVMGQHPLSYVLMVYLASELSKRILWFPLRHQMLHILPLLLLGQVVMLVARLIGGSAFPGWSYFLCAFVAALLWAPLNFVLLLPQFRPVDRDHTRPI
jgi:rod shape-determining protein MreD